MHSEIDYIHIEIKKGAVASFTKTPTPETLAMVRKLVERWEEKVNKNFDKPDVSGNEANPKNKQSGEVAVCECNREYYYANEVYNDNCELCQKKIKQTDR